MASFSEIIRLRVNDSQAQVLNAFIEADPDSNRHPRKDYRPSKTEIVQKFCDRQFRRGQTRRPQRRKCPQHAQPLDSRVYSATTGDYNKPLTAPFFIGQFIG